MLLRPYQKTFVEGCVDALHKHGSTLGVAPTGAGKTIILSAITGRMLREGARKALVLQHRQELVSQNATKFSKVNPDIRWSVYDAERKDWRGDVVFGMEPTLRLGANLDKMPAFDLVTIDEAHHVAANGYQRIIDRSRELNPDVKLLGVTATPNRGDKKALGPTFDNVGAQISIRELIGFGNLVRPRTFVIDVGVKAALKKVRRTVDDFDMAEVAEIMDKSPVTDAVIDHWQDKAGDRQTIVFCSTVAHAEHVAEAFRARGVKAAMLSGETPDAERKRLLADFDAGRIQVVTNCMVLTEGYDSQPVSCIILLRPCAYKSTMIQCIGRGLRTVDPNLYPGINKQDCIVLDFGCSTLVHGTLEQDVDLNPKKKRKGEIEEQITKSCPECGEEVPAGTRTCPGCGYEWLIESTKEPVSDFIMSEIDILARSSFRWMDIFGDDMALIATGFSAWAGCFGWNGAWHSIGGIGGAGIKRETRYLGVGTRLVAMALSDDWLNTHESDEAAHKSRYWLNAPATEKQLSVLGEASDGLMSSMSRYMAACKITFKFNRDRIQRLVMSRPMAMAA